MFENDKKHGANGSKNGGKQETTHGDLKIAILGLIFLGQKEIVSSNVSWFFPPSESGANIYKATGGTAGQMERREDVPLIDAAERVGEWKQGRVAVAVLVLVVGGGDEFVKQCQNHRHICCSSPAFPPSFQHFPAAL